MNDICPQCGDSRVIWSWNKCPHCNYTFTDSSPTPAVRAFVRGHPPIAIRLGLIVAAIVIFSLIVVSLDHSAKLLPGFYLLPIGLAVLIGPPELAHITIVASYLFFLYIISALFWAKRHWFVIAFIVFCVICSVSLQGCMKIFEGLSHIN
jgi:hypothetical protein